MGNLERQMPISTSNDCADQFLPIPMYNGSLNLKNTYIIKKSSFGFFMNAG